MKEDKNKNKPNKIKDYQDQEQKLKDMMEGNHNETREKDEKKKLMNNKMERKTIEEQAEENKQKALAKLGITENSKPQPETYS